MRLSGKLTIYFCLAVLVIMSFSCNTEQNEKNIDKKPASGLSPDAPPETEVLGKLIGSWDVEQSFITSDGTWSDTRRYAKWKWYYILDGQAIQDDWIIIDSLKNEHTTGTNIRIYNPGEKQWYMAWIDKTYRRLAPFTAVNDSGKVIMDGTNARGRHIKNIFYNITDNEFDWRQEWTFDEGKTWTVVTKIHGKRSKES